MKKFLKIMVLPFLALIMLTACGKDRNVTDAKNLYIEMSSICVVDEDNKFFSDTTRPNSLKIKYSDDVNLAINNTSATTPLQKMYVVIGYQQKILDNIFNYYENNMEDFYNKMSSVNLDKNRANGYYASVENLNNTLVGFKSSYLSFCDATAGGVTEVMEFDLTNYSFELNKVINSAFNFIYNFIDLYQTYCISDFSLVNATNLELKIQKSYVDIAYIVYLNNFQAFDFSVGSKGISDMSAIVSNYSKFSLVKDVKAIKNLSTSVIVGMDKDDANYDNTMKLVNDYLYSESVFAQRVETYKKLYFQENIYTITQYKFGLVQGVNYESYLNTLTKSKRSTIEFLDNFVFDTYAKLVSTINLIVA